MGRHQSKHITKYFGIMRSCAAVYGNNDSKGMFHLLYRFLTLSCSFLLALLPTNTKCNHIWKYWRSGIKANNLPNLLVLWVVQQLVDDGSAIGCYAPKWVLMGSIPSPATLFTSHMSKECVSTGCNYTNVCNDKSFSNCRLIPCRLRDSKVWIQTGLWQPILILTHSVIYELCISLWE